jgi:2-oxoglutarate ferredoxin oxidoreductase subunit beta
LKANRSENTITLEEGKPLLFGKEQEKALVLTDDKFQCVPSSDASTQAYCHDSGDLMAAMRLARLSFPEFPVPLGVYYQDTREPFELQGELKKETSDLSTLYQAKASWMLK